MLAITPARREDVPAIASLLAEVDHFYGAPEASSVAKRIADIDDVLFGNGPTVSVVLARVGDQVVGFVSYSFLWPAAGVTRSLYLKEMFVTEACRGRGVGSTLMDYLRTEAVKAGCSRVEWTADDDNPIALRFYERLGMPPQSGKVFYRMGLN